MSDSAIRIAFLWWLGVCAFCSCALAQTNPDTPEPTGELGFHYAYNSLQTSQTGESNQSGGSVYSEYFFRGTNPHFRGRSRFGLIADFSGSGSGSGSLYTFMFGPRLSTEWRKSHLVLYAEYKIGASHVRVNGVNAAGSQVSLTRNGFAWEFANVGLDLRVGQHYVVTLLQTEFLSTPVPDVASGGSHWQPDMRVSAGIGYRFGDRH